MQTYGITAKELLEKLAQTPGGSDLILTVGKPPQLKVYGEVYSVPDSEALTEQTAEELCLSILNAWS